MMIEKLVNLSDFDLNRENAKMILENNSEFRQVLIDELFENEIDYYCSEILEKIPEISWNINYSDVRIWTKFGSNVINIIEGIFDIDEYLTENCNIIISKLKVYHKYLTTCCQYDNRWDRLIARTEKLVDDLLNELEQMIGTYLEAINDDDDEIIEYCISSMEGIICSTIYINPKTLDLYELKHL